jgi:hypothetical protein
VPAGDYTVQLWDRFGGGGTFDDGIPPNTTYQWEIGNATRTISVVGGAVVALTATDTQANTPTTGAFYNSWTLWSYGACACTGDCPAGTTCGNGVCIDTLYDLNNCGAIGAACTSQQCCAGSCTDAGSDVKNCGECGHACASGMTCVNGACQ